MKIAEYFRNRFREMSVTIWIITALLMIFSYYVAFSCLRQNGVRISVTPQSESSLNVNAGTVSIRGAFIDDSWYNPENLYVSGNWTLDAEQHVYYSTNTDSIVLKVSCAEKVTLIFDVGPDKGQAMITGRNLTKVYNCNFAESVSYGSGCDLSAEEIGMHKQLTIYRIISFAICILAGVLTREWWFVYGRCKDRIKWNQVEKIYIVLLLPFVWLFLAYFSVSSSPLVPEAANYWGEDGACYNLLGKSCAQGKIPYVDIWEQKGPFIYWVYALGYLINENWGVFFLQVISVYTSFLLSYFIGKTIRGISTGIMTSIVTFLYYVIVMDEGALVEDFNLPILMLSMFLTIRYLKNVEKNICVPPIYAAVYGAAVGISLGFRATNCISVFAFTMCFTVYLLLKKEFKNLFQNAIAFLIGLAVVVLPVLMYFMIHGALDDLIYGAFLFPLQYAGRAVQTGHSAEKLFKMLLYMMPTIICIIFAFEQKKLSAISISCAALANIAMLGKLYFFPHYYIILLIFVPVAVGWAMQPHSNRPSIANRYGICYFLISVAFICGMCLMTYRAGSGRYNWLKGLRNTKEESTYVQTIKQQAALIPAEDRDSVISYNMGPKWFLITDIFPAFKHGCGAIEWFSSISERFRQECIDYYSSLSARWIVVQGENVMPDIQNILDTSYELYNSVDIQEGVSLNLYRLK